jgi:gluconokinase
MGVSGSGKTTLGKRLAADLGWPFVEGDGFHPPANIEKMSAGTPLSDADRDPWLRALRRFLETTAAGGGKAVLTCSALKHAYRAFLLDGLPGIALVYLKGDRELIRRRVAGRRGHYMKAPMVSGQFAILEEPADAVVVDVSLPVEAQVRRVREALGLGTSPSAPS